MASATDLLFSAALLACALSMSGSAEQPGEVRIRAAPYHPPTASISVDTNLVELVATVRDRQGAAIGGLQSSDFAVFDNSRPQTLSFSPSSARSRPR